MAVINSVANDHPTDHGPHSGEGARGRMTVDEFASQIGMSARNIRALQGRGLLPPPVRHGRRAFYLEQHVQRAEAIKDLQRQGYNLFAIGSVLGTGENDPQAAGLAALLERVANRHPALIAALQRHRIVAWNASGQLRVIRPKPVQTALALRELGVPLPAAIGALVAVLNAAESFSGELLHVVHGEIVDNWDPNRGPGLQTHPMTRTQTVVTLLSEAQRVVLENAGADLVRGVLDGSR
jgi:DNA-binding transcriptional MerR regulator